MSDLRIERLNDYCWIIPPFGGMRVPGIIYSTRDMMKGAGSDESPKQVANVAHLPGIIKYSLAMPDIHWGYGFPIGGVAAFDVREGIISPGGVGYDINCGVRLVTTGLRFENIRHRIKDLVIALFNTIPSGVGSKGVIRLNARDEKRVLQKGATWAVEHGYGSPEDLMVIEDGGSMDGADPEYVSERALERGKQQLGTLGSGNHFLEIEVVEEIFDKTAAQVLGLEHHQVAVMIHTGSRGLGYQICDDFLSRMVNNIGKLDIKLPDRQLACAYLSSPEGKEYFAAMSCAANYAWANRQILTHWTKATFEETLNISPRTLNMRLVYDVCHNIAKMETFNIDGKKVKACVHRKGATRALPPQHPALPEKYRSIGQPVLIPGDMGTGSYVLVGTEKALTDTFASSCHGAGRIMSRSQAIKTSKGRAINREMEDRGVIVMATGKGTLREEMPDAYKNLDDVVSVVHQAGLAKKVAKLRAVGCIKG